jgi:hypothetical protein
MVRGNPAAVVKETRQLGSRKKVGMTMMPNVTK